MTKVDIISGFLGSGKTTLIKKLLEEKLSGEKVVIIENEFGEIGIDGTILKNAGTEVKEMNAGCICCTLAGSFEKTIQEVIQQYKPERIIIEPSGVGKLSEIIKACQSPKLKANLHINMLITVVDVFKFERYLANFGEFFENQIRYAKTIMMSRTEKAPQEKLEKIVSSIKKINAKANIVTTPLESLRAERLIAIAEQDTDETLEGQVKKMVLQQGMQVGRCKCGQSHRERHQPSGQEFHPHHCADQVFEVWGIETPRIFPVEELKNKLALLENDSTFGVALRGKGFLQVDQVSWIQFDYVPGAIQIREVEPEYTGRVCIIGSHLNKPALEKLFYAGAYDGAEK
ncbi:MAG: GTP-binding protein [Clostridia bacterium]|nr:GTP-binding protein [Clostridia bacterium]